MMLGPVDVVPFDFHLFYAIFLPPCWVAAGAASLLPCGTVVSTRWAQGGP